jgi:hypothetical protein
MIMSFSILDHVSVLTPSGESKSKYLCPVCGGNDLDVSNDGKYNCFSGGCDTKAIASEILTLAGSPPKNPNKKLTPAKTNTEYLYLSRDGQQLAKTVKTARLDQDGNPKKKFAQAILSNGEWCWKPSTLPELKKQIPIYRLAEVREAIAQSLQIFVVEGEQVADALWSIDIPATTTIGGSGGYKSYGEYSQDLTGARLVLCPDRDNVGLKYIANFARDFNSQIEGYCLAGEIEGWSNPSDSRDLADDVLDRHVTKATILASIISVEDFNSIAFEAKPEPNPLAKDGLGKEDKGTIAERVLELAFAAEYFCTPDKATYADIKVDGVRETHSIRSRAFRLWLTGEFYDSEGKAINSNAMAEVLGVLDAKAVRSKVVREVNLRTAEHQGKVYLDLGSPDWSAVEVDAQGWRVVAEPPIRFTRPESLLALPTPIEGGSLDELKELINVDGDSWVLIITFLLFCFCPDRTYPVLVLSAHRGSGKTAAAEILKGLIDPGKGGLPGLPSTEGNLAARAVNRWLMVYDNVGYLNTDMSDLLCRMATKFDYSTRTLFTTIDETTSEFTRPQIITAIDALVTRDDLANRVLMAQLGEITEENRLPQRELNSRVEAARPRILGALLTALSRTLAALPNTKPDRLPRMADYGLFSIAAEEALGLKPGEFLKAFDQSAENSRQVVIEASPIGEAILRLMEAPANSVRWKGTASQLLNSLESFSDEGTVRSRYWPKASNSFARQLNRLKPDIKALGIEIVETREGRNKDKFITLQKVISLSRASEKTSSLSSESSESFASVALGGDDKGDDTLKGDDTFSETSSIGRDDTLGGDDKRTIEKIDIDPVGSFQYQGLQPEGDDGDDVFSLALDREQPMDLSEYLDEV